MKKRELLDKYYTYLALIKCYSDRTIDNYFRVAQSFLDHIDGKIDVISIEDVIDYLKNKSVSNNTKRNNIAALNCFGNFLVEHEIWKINLFSHIEHPEVEKKISKYLEVEEIESLLSVIDKSTVIGLRDYCMFEFIYSTGVRISELCNLKRDNLHVADGFAIVEGKGNKQRIVVFGSISKKYLEKYLFLSRNLLSPKHNSYVFVSQRGNKISRKTVWSRYDLYRKKAGIRQSSVHSLRHSFATHMLLNGADLMTVSKLLGHADLSTTEVYTHITDKTLEEAHEKYFNKKK